MKLAGVERSTPFVEADRLESLSCGCPSVSVPQRDLKATFAGLDHQEEYFPMISREDPQAFFGQAPESIQPRAPVPTPLRIQTGFGSLVNNDLEGNSSAKVEINNGNLYDFDSSDDEIMQMDSPIPRPSSQSSAGGPENQAGDAPRNTPSHQFTPLRNQMREELHTLRVSNVPYPLEITDANLSSLKPSFNSSN
jgi:hypothetical protein